MNDTLPTAGPEPQDDSQRPAGWYSDPELPGQVRWWSGFEWTGARMSADLVSTPPAEHQPRTAPSPWGPRPARARRAPRWRRWLCGALIALGLFLLGIAALLGLSTAYFLRQEPQAARIVTMQNGLCVFEVVAPTSPARNRVAAYCPKNATLGAQVSIIVFSDGSAIAMEPEERRAMMTTFLMLAVPGLVLVILGAAFRRPRRSLQL